MRINTGSQPMLRNIAPALKMKFGAVDIEEKPNTPQAAKRKWLGKIFHKCEEETALVRAISKVVFNGITGLSASLDDAQNADDANRYLFNFRSNIVTRIDKLIHDFEERMDRRFNRTLLDDVFAVTELLEETKFTDDNLAEQIKLFHKMLFELTRDMRFEAYV
jgi:hypothetical protein